MIQAITYFDETKYCPSRKIIRTQKRKETGTTWLNVYLKQGKCFPAYEL